jgi:hypothetical protein
MPVMPKGPLRAALPAGAWYYIGEAGEVPTGLSTFLRFYAPRKGRREHAKRLENVENDEMPEMQSTNQCEAYRHDTNLSGLRGMVAARTSRVLGHRGNSGRRSSVDAFEVMEGHNEWNRHVRNL